LSYRAEKSISLFVAHKFEIREFPSKYDDLKCIFEEYRTVRVKVTDRQDQKVVLNPDFSITYFDDRSKAYSKADDMFTRCQERATAATIVDPLASIELITECMQEQVQKEEELGREEASFHSAVHRSVAADLISFECGDVNKTDSIEITNSTFFYDDANSGRDSRHTVRNLHRLPTSEIFAVDNFVTDRTCDALKSLRQEMPPGAAANTDAAGTVVGIPTKRVTEDKDSTKDAALVHALYTKIYDLLDDRFDHWDELGDLAGETIFDYVRDTEGVERPALLCVGAEEVSEAFAAIEAGIPQRCHIPGGEPVRVPTKKFVVDAKGHKSNGNGNGNGDQHLYQVAQIFVFCDEPDQQLGGVHFPYAGVHATPKAGKLVVAVHRHATRSGIGSDNHGLDGYVDEYHFCPNHELYTHTVTLAH